MIDLFMNKSLQFSKSDLKNVNLNKDIINSALCTIQFTLALLWHSPFTQFSRLRRNDNPRNESAQKDFVFGYFWTRMPAQKVLHICLVNCFAHPAKFPR